MILAGSIDQMEANYGICFLAVDVPGTDISRGNILVPFCSGKRNNSVMAVEVALQARRLDLSEEDLSAGFWSDLTFGTVVPDLSRWIVNGEAGFYTLVVREEIFVSDRAAEEREYANPRLRREGMSLTEANTGTTVRRVPPGSIAPVGERRRVFP